MGYMNEHVHRYIKVRISSDYLGLYPFMKSSHRFVPEVPAPRARSVTAAARLTRLGVPRRGPWTRVMTFQKNVLTELITQ